MKFFLYNFIVLFLVFAGVIKADITTALVAHYEFEDNINNSSGNFYGSDVEAVGGKFNLSDSVTSTTINGVFEGSRAQ